MNQEDKVLLFDAQWNSMMAELALQAVALRLTRGWSRDELATRSGVPANVIAQVERGKGKRLSLTTLTQLAGAFDVGLLARFVAWSEALQKAAKQPDVPVPSYDEEAKP